MEKIDHKPDICVNTEVLEEKQTIVHCTISNADNDLLVRIWPTTYLRDTQNGNLSELISAYNITFYPLWTPVGNNHVFTLIFEGLNHNCISFDLIEKIPQAGGFYVPGISRNQSDVYSIVV